jgi:phage terminase Nu1 subunit (DNA packaging protein)
MDLRSYYKKLREAEATLTGQHLVMVSLETSEGGKAGVRTEMPRAIAAKLIAEERARVATEEEAREFHEANREARETHEEAEAAKRVQVMVIPAREFKKQREQD